MDYVLTDEATLSQLIGTLATDIVKVGITTAVSIGVAMVAGAFLLAIGPILAVVAVGVVGTILLDSIDQYYGFTEKVIAGLDEMGNDSQAYIDQKKVKQRRLRQMLQSQSLIMYLIQSVKQRSILQSIQ